MEREVSKKMAGVIYRCLALLIMGGWSASALGLSEVYYVHTDHLGTPQVLTDADQKVVWERSQTPFGETVEESGAIVQPQRFPGQYEDPETGFHYNYFRDYDPTIGRYMQSDPIGLSGGMNTFGYVLQNPIMLVDPFGLKTVPCSPGTASPGVSCWVTTPDGGGERDGPYALDYCPSGDCAAFPPNYSSSAPASCETKCSQSYAGDWVLGLGIGTAYTAAGGPAGLAYFAGSLGLAGGTAAYGACMEACKNQNSCPIPQ